MAQVQKIDEGIKVFGDVDRTKDGKVKSEYPAYYFTQQKDDLEESIRHKKSMLEKDLVPMSEIGIQRERLKAEEKRLDEINEGTPKLTGPQMDEVANIRESLGKKIKESMYSRSQMERGVADPHEEARRISEPCIKLETHEISFVKNCDVPIANDGKVSRDAASKAWKIASKLLGEMSNVEMLRKP